MKFIKRSVIVDAEQWFPGAEIEGVIKNALGEPGAGNQDEFFLNTPHGYFLLEEGDWIVSVSGEKRIMKPDDFNAIFEPFDAADCCSRRFGKEG